MSLNRLFTIAALCLATLFVTTLSQARPMGMLFAVPFEFYVGDKLLPAGTYVVQLDKTAGYVELHNRTSFARLGISASPALRDGNYATLDGRLTFYSYGAAHVLKRVWMEGETRGALLQPTRAEREMARTEHTKAVVEIAAR